MDVPEDGAVPRVEITRDSEAMARYGESIWLQGRSNMRDGGSQGHFPALTS
jgi:hypothetical protein